MRSSPMVTGRLRKGLGAAAMWTAIAWMLPESLRAQPDLLFLQAPTGEIHSDSLVTLTVAAARPASGAPESCALYRGPVPAGNDLEGHPLRLAAARSLAPGGAAVRFSFRPSDRDSGAAGPQLGLGFHYVIAACGDGKSVTPEIPIWVTTRQSAAITSPRSRETSFGPNIAWTPVPGVPAYHILLSDQALVIDPDKGTVSGASVIWQAITTGASIAYGTPDPSGNFSRMPAPPLSPGVPYNLVVLNNYDGRSALATSAKAQGLRLFRIEATATLKPPANIAPAPEAVITAAADSTLLFRWTAAKAAAAGARANTYRVFVYSMEAGDAGEILVPIWNTEVTDTFTVMDARRVLLTKRYYWKVFALDASGAAVVGDTTSFLYRNETRTLTIRTRTLGPSGDTVPLGNVRIDVAPLDGSADPLPLFTGNDGFAEKELAIGGYVLTFAKDGYLSRSRTVLLDPMIQAKAEELLPPSQCRITGRAIDASGLALVNVQVTASSGGKSVSAATDAAGFFLLGVAPGGHSVSLAKPDYRTVPDTVIALEAGASVDLGGLVLEKAAGALTGSVAAAGSPLAGCRIIVKGAAGAAERILLTDGNGAFSAYLAPGDYTVTAERTGFSTESKSLRLAESAHLAFALASGASLLKGRIFLAARPSASETRTAPLSGAMVELVDAVRGVTRTAETDLRGEFFFSADTGAYMLKGSRPGLAFPESASVRIAAPRSTLVRDLSLRGFASVAGTLAFDPDTLADPADVTISLLAMPSGVLAASTFPRSAPRTGSAGGMAFSLDGIPDGSYRLACGMAGFGPDEEPLVTIAGGVWKTDLDLTLKKGGKSLTFALTSGGGTVPGSIRFFTPRALVISADRALEGAAAGTYTLDAVPENAELIPVAGHAFRLPAAAGDTAIAFDFPFSHRPMPLSFRQGEVEMVFEAGAGADSAFLVYGYGAPRDTFKLAAGLLSGAPGPRAFRFRPGAQGGPLTYHFAIRSGPYLYSNADPARRFRAEVIPSGELAYLKPAAGDSLRLPARSRGEILLHAFDAAGRSLDAALDARGTLTWSAGGLPIELDRNSRRTLAYTTSAAAPSASPAALGKRSAASPWGTLSVTVRLDGALLILDIPATVVEATINRLEISTTLGEAAGIPSPEPFGISVTGYDTTTTPPTPLVANPVLTLDPPGAGSIEDMRARLHPDFIGPLRVLARHVNADGSEASTELGAARDSLSRGLNVGQTLGPGDSARLLIHDAGFEMAVPDSALASEGPAVLRLYKRSVSKTFANGPGFAVSGDIYEISNPSGSVFGKRPRIALGIPAASPNRAHTLKRFDVFTLEWEGLSDSVREESNSFGMDARSAEIRDMDGSYYGLLGASRGLTAGEVRIIPNPFSPLVLAARDGNTTYGARIRFHPESDRSPEVTVSVKIYNLDGELVRLLVDHKTVPKAPTEFYWDGRTDGGRWARNGRYLVKISVGSTGASQVKHLVRPIVVFQ